MLSQEIRRHFLRYFKENGHAVIPSSSVVPHEDPTLLFINAGMNQFKDVFLGKSARDYKRAVTAQKCIRVGGKHNDLDNVGHTSRHLTFFEMLGNFSFGDYFKKEAIAYAWEVATSVFQFDPEKIWVTVFQEDDEAHALWQRFVPEKRLVRMGEKDNFWAMGDTGPCGPCSELLYDRGERYGYAPSPKEDASGERYLEFWNLVFMQFNRDPSGALTPLPKQSIDTGAGLERVLSLRMGVDTVFATDVFASLIAQVEQVSGKRYAPENAPAFHVIADHIRSLSFAIADGAQPSNIDRGYVLRKLVRRAVRYGRGLGMQEPFLARVLPRLVETMGPDYRELATSQNRIAEILTTEEEAFFRTLKRGGNILNNVIDKAQSSPLKQISGEEAFKLKDTYGFPLEEILLIAKDTGLEVNLEAYELLEEQAKEKSRSAQAVHAQQIEDSLYKDFAETHGPTEFLGYTTTETEGTVTGLIVNGVLVNAMTEGQEGMVILNQTPFYAEKGGQVGDHGTLSHHRAHFTVSDCQTPYPGITAHIGTLTRGSLIVGEPLKATVDASRRQGIANHHTATHLLHWALQQVAGEHIKQAGSLVESDRLRFDFNHHKALAAAEMRAIEQKVNAKIREDRDVRIYELSFDEAQKRPDIKQFFGDKYGASVRVVDIDYSKELCGGTHTSRVGTIGLFRITKESSIAAGVRRIEAVTGPAAETFMYAQEDLAHTTAALLKAPVAQLPEKVSHLLEDHKRLSHDLRGMKKQQMKQLAVELARTATSVHGVPFLAAQTALDGSELPLLADLLLEILPSCVLLLGAAAEGRCQLLARVTPDLVKKGVQAGVLIKETAPCISGTGGGKGESAQAGGKQPEGLPQAFAKAQNHLAQLLGG
jgi:alanyl-tRNA synthetase